MKIYRNLDLVATGAVVKASAGKLCGWYLANNASSARFVKIYNKATAADETDTPVITIQLPASGAANVLCAAGIDFSLGIGARATTAIADDDTGAPTTNDVVVNLFYR